MSVPYDCPNCGAHFYGPFAGVGAHPLCEGCEEAKRLRGMLRDLINIFDGVPGWTRLSIERESEIRAAAKEPA